MGQRDKLLIKVLCGKRDNDIPFDEICGLLKHLGFSERIKGSHHIYCRDGIEEILNIQPLRGKAKAYQVKQIRNVIIRYKLGDELDV